MDDAVEFFEAEAIRHARTLPIAEARRFLAGLLAVAEPDALPASRIAFTNLCVSDDQLELIARGKNGGRA
jgi:hypothetical protein